MSNMYPSEFPKHPSPHDPEFEVFQYLRLLPANYKVYYSKKFKGGDFYREECELDFIVFDIGAFRFNCHRSPRYLYQPRKLPSHCRCVPRAF